MFNEGENEMAATDLSDFAWDELLEEVGRRIGSLMYAKSEEYEDMDDMDGILEEEMVDEFLGMETDFGEKISNAAVAQFRRLHKEENGW